MNKSNSQLKDTLEAVCNAVGERERTFLLSDTKDTSRAFDCKCCKVRFFPTKHQWIFHNLCDECFYKFDEQKMAARISQIVGDGSITGFEDVDEWISSLRK